MYIHNLDPIIINFGFLEIRWYSLAYIFGIFLGFYYAKYLIKKFWYKENINVQVLDNFLIYLILEREGVVDLLNNMTKNKY